MNVGAAEVKVASDADIDRAYIKNGFPSREFITYIL